MKRREQLEWIGHYIATVPPKSELISDLRSVYEVVTLYGSNSGLGTSMEGIGLLGGPFKVLPTTGTQLEVVSSSSNDTAAGTGMRTMRIVYETTDHTVASEDITLNGTGAVTTTATNITYLYPHLCHGLTYGSTGLANGNIDMQVVSAAGVVERIVAGRKGLVKSARNRVPPGHTGFVFDWSVGMAGAEVAEFALCHDWDARTGDHLESTVVRYMLDGVSSGWVTQELALPMVLPEKTNIEITGMRLGSSDAAGAASLDLILVPNS